jgi:hypothetical protein
LEIAKKSPKKQFEGNSPNLLWESQSVRPSPS